MHAAGWVGLSWPKQYGGRGANFMQQVIFDGEYTRARAPVLPGASGLNLLVPSLIHWGTEEQCRRIVVPGLFRARCRRRSRQSQNPSCRPRRPFCRQRSEGVDLGRTFRGLVFLLVRTDPQAPKHHGISYLLVDIKTPGITVWPLVLLNGHRHFNEVFFVDNLPDR
jgi:alkylation response protein AidB-like acyl-CoA dehydrogenase